mmetsp:Transcript_52906/g.153974  ORF Transcript_52906/g.153974 Transcript_52906/m.153974 type:complete len:231 (-) Transcript_52906:388-1080(-)
MHLDVLAPLALQRQRIQQKWPHKAHEFSITGGSHAKGLVRAAAGHLEPLPADAHVVAAGELIKEGPDVPRPCTRMDHAGSQSAAQQFQGGPHAVRGEWLGGGDRLQGVDYEFGDEPVEGAAQEGPLAIIGPDVQRWGLLVINRQAHGAGDDVHHRAKASRRQDKARRPGGTAGPPHLGRPCRQSDPHQRVARVRTRGEELPPLEDTLVLDKLHARLCWQGHEHQPAQQHH